MNLPTTAGPLQGDFLRVGLLQRPAKTPKGLYRAPKLCDVIRGQMAKVERRDCMKSGPRMVFRYSSRYAKTLPNRSLRCRVELHRASLARSQWSWTTKDPRSP